MSRFGLIFLLAAAVCLPAAEKWTPEDVLHQESAGALDLSRDGRLAVYTRSKIDREKGVSVSNIFLKHIADDFEIALTRGSDGASSPKFSPDSKRVAFLTSRKAPGAPAASGDAGAGGGSQVWLIDVRGGEPWALTKMEKGVRAFDWLDDNTLLLVAAEDSSLFELNNKDRKDNTNVLDDEDHASPVRLFKFEIKGSKVTRLTTNADRITNVTVSPDGAWAVTNHNRSLAETFNQKIKPVTFLHDLAKGTSLQLFAGLKLQARNFNFTRDSKGFYFMAPFSSHAYLDNASVTRMYYYDLASARHTEVQLDWERGAGYSYDITENGFVAILLDGARNRVARFTRSGDSWNRAWLEGEHARNIFSVTTAFDGKSIVYNYTTASIPAVWMRASLDGARIADPKPLIKTNTGWAKKNISKTEVITWTGALDEEIEGILYYPHNYEAGKKYPLVVMIHGGPHGHDADAFRESWGYPHQLMAQRGAFILKPNYHGSSGYGLKFGESISGGKYNDLEWIDVEKGVDHLIAKGLVDPKMLGVMGWSNGSIIAIELTTRTNRYKAAGAGAGNVNWISDWGNAVFGDSFDSYYLGTTPMDNPDLYVRKSPLFRMDKVTTPTIIFFGTEDKQVPTEQGWQHYRALQHYGKTDVKFLLFPGEAHGLRRVAFQQRKLEEELRWFDKHLFGTLKDDNEALKKESALAAVIKVQKLNDVPEVAERAAFHLGRFEVTRDQFKAFEPSYQFPAGTGHYPANGISFEKAKAYCEWLSKKTGQKFRLGTEEELGSLLAAARTENTLDAWAGYTVNPDDAGRLASLLDGLAPGALLKPVGSNPGKGDDPVYDLGGNVAEWVVTKDGQGKVLGGSADRPVDPKAQGQPRPEYIGFRVVRE
ncbi:MAG: prolyl oligopeptidase family serine peptidase [Bryobacteraceae bacterium]|nr:prolyl oligopeptidase family serine peptidase [Bryobacteraceae bacterium]